VHGGAWWQARHDGGVHPLPVPRLTDGVIALRPVEDRDVPGIVAACRDPEIPRWTRVPSPYTPEDARAYLAIARADAAVGVGLALAITDAEDGFIGTIGLMEVDRARGTGEIGYWIAAPARGRGVTVRAILLLRDWAVRELALTTLDILPHEDNVPSRVVAERAGFPWTGELATIRRMPPGRQQGYRVHRWHAGPPPATSPPPAAPR
jgi:RimJ/RimL family protein N-acetyltransferase